jgi:hypothetical protein
MPCETLLNMNNHRTVGGYKDVVIIGNGPSAICLSYFLSGHWPYWNKTPVSDEYLQMRLEYCDNGLSLVEQDLEYLSDGLEGRSSNPVALLYDRLKHPDGDLGIDSPSCLSWTYDPSKEIDHICIGKSSGAGGSWNDLDGSSLTISPSRWMELPELSFSDWKRSSKSNISAGLIFSSKTSNFSEDNSMLNGNALRKNTSSSSKLFNTQLSNEESRASMKDIRNYYRDYVKQKNLDKYLVNNATVTSVRRVNCKLMADSMTISITTNDNNKSNQNDSSSCTLWEVVGLIDKRDRKKASSLTHKGDLMEFKFFCKHLVLANGANDLPNELNVKGENLRFILRSIRELEEKIKEDLPRLQKDPLLIVGGGLSAADAVLLAQKYHIRIIHVIRKSINDNDLIFNKLPKKVYPEYQRVYEQMLHNKYTSWTDDTSTASNDDMASKRYILYDEHHVKCFTSKRTCVLVSACHNEKKEEKIKCNRHLHIQRQHHQQHQRQMNEFDEELDSNDSQISTEMCTLSLNNTNLRDKEIKISYACVLIGCSPDLDFFPAYISNELAVNTVKRLNTKENTISINSFTHESSKFNNLFAMGPLIGDNFVRFGTGGALPICSAIWNYKKKEKKHTKQS